MLIPEHEQRDVLIYAFRYTIGRATYAVHTMVEVITYAWDDMDAHSKKLIKREIKEAIDSKRAGHLCDIEMWETILSFDA